MRVAFLVAVSSVFVSGVLGFVACSSSDDTASPDGGTFASSSGGTSGGSSGSSGTPSGDGGCLLFHTDILEGTTAENVSAPGKIDWTNPQGALVPSDNQFAQVVLNDGQESAVLKVSGFNLQVPATADPYGIIVELLRRTLTDGGVLQTSKVAVSIPNSGYKFDDPTFFWPRTPVADGGYGDHSYGQAVDSWGVNLQASDFGPGFFVTLAVQKSPEGGAPGPITGSVDTMRLQVWYASATPDKCQR